MTTEPVGSIDVGIVAYGAEGLLRRALQSLSADLAVATVTVVDHLPPAARAAAAGVGARYIEDPTNPGFGAGQNRAFANGAAPFFLILNPDAEMVEGALCAGVAEMQRRPDVVAIQGVIAHRSDAGVDRSGGRELTWVHLVGRATHARSLLGLRPVRWLVQRTRLRDTTDRIPEQSTEVQWLAATALLVRRSAMEEIGGFDSTYFLYGEDLDLCRRLRQQGGTLLALPDPWALHEDGSTSSGWWRRELVWWEGTMRFAALNWSTLGLVLASTAAALQCVQLVVRRPRSIATAVAALLIRPWRARRGRQGR